MCHTDAFTLSGADPEGVFPVVLAHEGAGVIVEVGEEVTDVAVSNHVIPLYTAGLTFLCRVFYALQTIENIDLFTPNSKIRVSLSQT